MELKIAENIKKIRKERNMTQEQLAAAFGVTVGAVSKWESGASVPDIMIIMELARFFGISVDVLLGHEIAEDEGVYYYETIRNLRNEKRFEEAISVAERALLKYPYNFDFMHYTGILYSLTLVETRNEKYFNRALELFNCSLKLISQNKDPRISEWTIQNRIAFLYALNGEYDEALRRLKENNADGVNNARIGKLLVTEKEEYLEGLQYLSLSLLEKVSDIHQIVESYVNAYSGLKKYDEAVSICEQMVAFLKGFVIPGKVSHYNMEIVQTLTTLTCIYMESGDEEKALETLRRTYAEAVIFDNNPSNSFENTRHFYSACEPTAFDDFGNNAVNGVRNALAVQDDYGEKLAKLWDGLSLELT